MPRDSALARELHGEAADWMVTDQLLAQVVDQLAKVNRMFATVNRDEEAEPLDFPQPVPRPGGQVEDDTAPGEPQDGPPHPELPSPQELDRLFGAR
ncbi:hypothetical protein ACWD6R_30135 [Streptomyces sp. NPDC005151]